GRRRPPRGVPRGGRRRGRLPRPERHHPLAARLGEPPGGAPRRGRGGRRTPRVGTPLRGGPDGRDTCLRPSRAFGTFGPRGAARPPDSMAAMEASPPDLPQPAPDTPEPSRRDGAFAIAIAVALVAMVGAVVAVGLGWRAVDESRASGGGGGGGGGAPATATVSMTEFAITPAEVAAGGQLDVRNDGAIEHNLAVEGTELITADLGAGESEALPLDGLAPGTYTIYCEIPGHRDAGMEATLTVSEGGGST